MKLHRVTRGTPILEPVYSKHGKDCLAACVATLTGADVERIDKVYQAAWREIGEGRFSLLEAVRHWIDVVNEELWKADAQHSRFRLRGPLPVQPLGLSISVCEGPLKEDTMTSHAVVVRAMPGVCLQVVHDPGFAPYTFDPMSYFFIAVEVIDSESPQELAFTKVFSEKYPELASAYDDPPA